MPTLIESTRFLLTISLAALIAACTAFEVKLVGPALDEAEIKKLIVGNTLQGPMGTELYDWYYQADGAVTGVIGPSDDDSGTWSIKDSTLSVSNGINTLMASGTVMSGTRRSEAANT